MGLAHLFNLLLKMVYLGVLLIDEVKLSKVAFLHWGSAGGSRGMELKTEASLRAERRQKQRQKNRDR